MKLEYRTLANAWVSLEPLDERHKGDLSEAIGDPRDTLKYSPSPQLYHDGLGAMIDWQIEQGRAGRWQPYAVMFEGRAVGQSSFINPREYDRGVEIGGTWYAASVRDLATSTAGLPLVLSTHLPPARNRGDQLLDVLADAPDQPPFVGPDQAALEALLAGFAPTPT